MNGLTQDMNVATEQSFGIFWPIFYSACTEMPYFYFHFKIWPQVSILQCWLPIVTWNLATGPHF